MPRLSEAEKQKSHARILKAAARLFREQGIETTSVADVMKAAGMTHGGFYRHFSGKDALVTAAFGHAVDGAVGQIEAASTESDRVSALTDYVQTYLSGDHVQSVGVGCPLAALGSEMVRADGELRAEASAAVKRVAGLLQDKDLEASGYARLALLLGAVTLARLSEEEEQQNHILSAAGAAYDRL